MKLSRFFCNWRQILCHHNHKFALSKSIFTVIRAPITVAKMVQCTPRPGASLTNGLYIARSFGQYGSKSGGLSQNHLPRWIQSQLSWWRLGSSLREPNLGIGSMSQVVSWAQLELVLQYIVFGILAAKDFLGRLKSLRTRDRFFENFYRVELSCDP